MFYAPGQEQDMREHAKYHAQVTKGIKAQVWMLKSGKSQLRNACGCNVGSSSVVVLSVVLNTLPAVQGLHDAVAIPTAAGKHRLMVVNHECRSGVLQRKVSTAVGSCMPWAIVAPLHCEAHSRGMLQNRASAQMNMQVRQISNMLNEQLDLQDPDWLLSVDSKVSLVCRLAADLL